MKYRLEEEQRAIILQWLKDGYMDNTQLYKLENPHPIPEEEMRFLCDRLAKVFFSDYCIQMKETGKCELFNQCRECKMFNHCKERE